MDIVLIPAYEPNHVLTELVRQLKAEDFEILVVDDGSGAEYSSVFESVKPFATVITHTQNRGKGAALKTGMKYIRDHTDFENFITCDADGQHKPSDVVRVRECLHNGQKFVLTTRIRKKDIPFRSKLGNSLSRIVYALLTNRYLSDNQSGLRGFNKCHIDWLIDVEKDNYDYEMNVLYYSVKRNVRISTLPIESVYIDNNSSSHFNPLLDTFRIYRSLFSLAFGSFMAFIVAEALVLAISIFLGYTNLLITLPSVGAISFVVCIMLNKHVIFRKTPCYDHWNILIYTIFSYFLYTLFCAVYMYRFPQIPLWVAFNITYILFLPLRYYLHKFIYVASKPKD